MRSDQLVASFRAASDGSLAAPAACAIVRGSAYLPPSQEVTVNADLLEKGIAGGATEAFVLIRHLAVAWQARPAIEP